MLSKKIVKYIQSLSHKKFREEEGAFIAEGPKVVGEFLAQKKMEAYVICAQNEWLQANEELLEGVDRNRVHETDLQGLKSVSQMKTPNQVVAVFRKNEKAPVTHLSGKISIMLDYLQDPGNLGTIIRIADWFGIENVICSRNSVECYNPKVVQSTMGSLARVNVVYTDLEMFIREHQQVPVLGTTLTGTSIFKLPPLTEGILLIGNEAGGIQPALLQLCQQEITIPRIGRAESLNAAVATGIVVAQLAGRLHRL